MSDVNKIAITLENSYYINQFLETAGNSLEGFRYFSKRSVQVLQNHICTFLFLENEIPVCYGHLDNDQGKVWLGVAVIESRKGKGLGTLMINELIKSGKEKNVSAIYLTVDKVNSSAIKLYERTGFIKVQEKETYSEYRLEVKQ